MKKSIIPFLLILFVICSAIINSGCSQKSVKIKFDSSMEGSGHVVTVLFLIYGTNNKYLKVHE